MHLRALTYLAPSIPLDFFAGVVEHLAHALSCTVELRSEEKFSGPMLDDPDPFELGEADLGFLCAPSFLALRGQPRPSVDLVPAGFVFRDHRHRGEPVYWSDVVVRRDHRARTFPELEGGTWSYNDENSLSGYFAMRQWLLETGRDRSFFRRYVRSGSHAASITAVLEGRADAASIDSVMLSRLQRERPDLVAELRVVESFGPFPIQPVVVRRGLGPGFGARVAAALHGLDQSIPSGRALARHGYDRAVPIDEAHYTDERGALIRLGEIPA